MINHLLTALQSRPLVTVFNDEGQPGQPTKLPAVFRAPIRSDLGKLERMFYVHEKLWPMRLELDDILN